MSKEILEGIQAHIEQQGLLHKDWLNLKEACLYTGISQSYMYKLTSKREIPFFKPQGKKIFFKRLDLDRWLLRNRIDTQEEIEGQAANYLISKGKARL